MVDTMEDTISFCPYHEQCACDVKIKFKCFFHNKKRKAFRKFIFSHTCQHTWHQSDVCTIQLMPLLFITLLVWDIAMKKMEKKKKKIKNIKLNS